ncbi:hypothetical protein Salat_2105400 [Sesamum alatum]|uniref:Uncharacterized protein n=1 Tax=Sesamum alatum TaxID=300844 RepID=A0AAE2CGQ0_9LAMI|nr:hypothetical protein Salat_2105400 [Sesamum alatum]
MAEEPTTHGRRREDLLNNLFGEDVDYYSTVSPASACYGNNSSTTKPVHSRKCKVSKTDLDKRFLDSIDRLVSNTNDCLNSIVKRTGFEVDVSEERQKVYEKLENCTKLKIVNNTQDMDLFFSLPVDANGEFVA